MNFFFFAECSRSGRSAKFFFIFFFSFVFRKKILFLCRVFILILGKHPLCRVFFLTLGKPPLYRVFFLLSVFSAALGKELVCRVPERIHSTNIKTLGKFDVSGSVGNRHLQHKCTNIATYATSRSTFLQHPNETLKTYLRNM